MNFKKMILPAALIAFGAIHSTAAENAAENITLKANVQTQGSKMFDDEDNNLSSFWFRANVGAQYKSENLDGQVMLRIFAPEFGNTIEGKAYDKISADLYWANYKWALNDSHKLNLKFGHWKTNWSESSFFGTYIDVPLTSRGLESSDKALNGVEVGWGFGISQLNVMLATTDSKWNTGYLRIEEDLKFSFPLTLNLAYRVNALDNIQNTTYTTHRFAAKAAYEIAKKFRVYGELAFLTTSEDDDVNVNAANYVNTQDGYLKPGETYVPFYLGVEIPTPILDHLYAEVEYIKDRDQLSSKQPDADDLGWALTLVKNAGKAKVQFGVYSGEKVSDVGIASRVSVNFN